MTQLFNLNYTYWHSQIKLNDTHIKEVFPKLYKDGVFILKKTRNHSSVSQSKKIAVCFSGGPAPGGHSVVAAIAKHCQAKHNLVGILNGPKGLLNESFVNLKLADIETFNHTGGFHLLGTDRTKLTTTAQFNAIKANVLKHNINGLILIGGDDTHTNAVFLAEALYDIGCSVVGVPKTIDGDLRYDPYLPLPFGFSTVVDLYAMLVKNLILDTKSTQKYWHIVKLMGRTTSHVTQQVGLISNPDMCIISEYLAKQSTSLAELITQITTKIQTDYTRNKAYGVICFAEGLLEFLPDVTALIQQLNSLVSVKNYTVTSVYTKLSKLNQQTFKLFPSYIQEQLLLDRDSHGNINLSRIDSERCLIELCQQDLAKKFNNSAIQFIPHFFGYIGRCHTPNAQDKSLCTHLGSIAAELVLENHTGYMAAFNPADPTMQYYGVPILAMLIKQARGNNLTYVVKKVLVD
jgi:diphosphate-dependent phosphofructokinase